MPWLHSKTLKDQKKKSSLKLTNKENLKNSKSPNLMNNLNSIGKKNKLIEVVIDQIEERFLN